MSLSLLMLAVPKVLRLANSVLEEHVIPQRRLKRHDTEKEVLHKVSLHIDDADVSIDMALTDRDIHELESSDGWKVIERGVTTYNMHGET